MLLQETTSVYFNNIIRRNVSPMTVNDLDPAVVEEFIGLIRAAFPDTAEASARHLRYLVPYILQNIDWSEYGSPLQPWQLAYYYQRERFLKKTGLNYEDFLAHKPMQTAISRLGLDPEPTFEFILFLKYYYGLRADLRFSCLEQLEMLTRELDEAPVDANVTLDVGINGKHVKISDPLFVREMFKAINKDALSGGRFENDFTQGSARDKIRAIDYFIVKTLLDYLPTDKSLRRGGRYSQPERNLGLSVLSVCGRLPDTDREGECSQENNATFDKLMRDFAGQPIPFAMELFL